MDVAGLQVPISLSLSTIHKGEPTREFVGTRANGTCARASPFLAQGRYLVYVFLRKVGEAEASCWLLFTSFPSTCTPGSTGLFQGQPLRKP